MKAFFQAYHETKIYECKDSDFFYDQPINDEYLEDLEQISVSTCIEPYNIPPLFDDYE